MGEESQAWRLGTHSGLQATFGLFLLPGGLPRRFTAALQAGGRPAAATARCQGLQGDDDPFETLTLSSKLSEQFFRRPFVAGYQSVA